MTAGCRQDGPGGKSWEANGEVVGGNPVNTESSHLPWIHFPFSWELCPNLPLGTIAPQFQARCFGQGLSHPHSISRARYVTRASPSRRAPSPGHTGWFKNKPSLKLVQGEPALVLLQEPLEREPAVCTGFAN